MPDTVEFIGPYFDSRYDAASAHMDRQIEDDVAHHGVEIVRGNMSASIHVDGPGYASRHVKADRATSQGTDVYDDNATYGPWLEGTGSRNETTRFKGYASIRRSVQQLDRDSDKYAQAAVDAFVREMNS
jgi:hypothetical protein